MIVPIIRVYCLDCGEQFSCLEGSAASKDQLCLTCWQARAAARSVPEKPDGPKAA